RLMKYTIKFSIFIFSILSLNSFAQNTFYKINGGKPVTEKTYIQEKENITKKGKLEELLLKTDNKKDSIINYVRLTTLSSTPDGFDPYAETKKFIGTRFKIEKFLNDSS